MTRSSSTAFSLGRSGGGRFLSSWAILFFPQLLGATGAGIFEGRRYLVQMRSLDMVPIQASLAVGLLVVICSCPSSSFARSSACASKSANALSSRSSPLPLEVRKFVWRHPGRGRGLYCHPIHPLPIGRLLLMKILRLARSCQSFYLLIIYLNLLSFLSSNATTRPLRWLVI